MAIGNFQDKHSIGIMSEVDSTRSLHFIHPQGLTLRINHLQLQTLEGSLSLVGRGQWTGAHWSFRGEASAAPEREQALGNLLNMVGRRQGVRSVISLG